jgi:hypothetical protein
MAVPNNILTQVATYQMANLAFLQNEYAFINRSNKKFNDFDKIKYNLGSSVTFELTPRAQSTNSLVATFSPIVQRFATLTVNQEISASTSFTAQQFIFNVEEYMQRFGKAMVKKAGATIEKTIAANYCAQAFRFFGDGINPINSYTQLAKMLAFNDNFGAPEGMKEVYLSDMIVPDIIGTGLSQFVLDRNEESAYKWMIGDFQNASFYKTNVLPIHTAGTVGNAQTTMTVVSTNDNTGASITQLTLSGAANNDTNAFKAGDLIQFQDAVSGQPNMRYTTFIEPGVVSSCPVQARVTADAGSNGSGQVTINIFPALSINPLANQTAATLVVGINNNIAAGMQLKALPTHRQGLVVSDKATYLAMPRLPEEVPYPTANETDEDTGANLRTYYGSKFGLNERGMVVDAIYGSTAVPENLQLIVTPL